MYLLVVEKASAKETVLDWLVTQSPQAEIREFRVEHGAVSEIDLTVSKKVKAFQKLKSCFMWEAKYHGLIWNMRKKGTG